MGPSIASSSFYGQIDPILRLIAHLFVPGLAEFSMGLFSLTDRKIHRLLPLTPIHPMPNNRSLPEKRGGSSVFARLT